MPRSPWSVAAEVVITVVLLVVPPWLATRLEWPLGPDTTWVWFLQYLRSGSIPDEVVLAFFVVFLWGVWAAHLVVVALDVVAAVRGLVPRVGLVRLVWVLVAGGATATSAQTTAVAAHTTDAVAEAPTMADTPPAQETPMAEEEQAKPQDVFDRTSILAGFGFDSADLPSEMAESLEPTIGLIADFGHPGEPVVVTGHTDPIGTPFYNQGLSERRAQAVADHLADQLDADVEIQVIGKGAAQPPSHPRASYGEYRRAEISYTVQRPTPTAVPEPSAVSGADTTSKTSSGAASASEREWTGVTTAAEGNTVRDLAGVGVVSGAVGAGVGYAAGRRRASVTPRKPGTRVGLTTGPDDPSGETSTDDAAPVQEDLVRHDAEGLTRGVLDDDGYLLVADTVRVNSAGGVAFVGVHEVRALAAVVTDHAPGPVIATRAVATALVAEGTPLGGVQVTSDLAQA
ncbi:OmpA family protein, partial [Nocardiopsis sp. NPDC049922]|uniref:OmpA family protein n=1 Tax=Nocardiopsis sp. NPDC049922 TaxID=3155157 RepID=UPI0033EEFF10